MDLIEVRRQRDLMLAATDIFMLQDWPHKEGELDAWKKYRQDLREITSLPSFDKENDFWPLPPRRYTFLNGIDRPNFPNGFVGDFE